MIDFKILKKYDTQKMYEIYNQWPTISLESYEFDYQPYGYVDMDHIVFAGMGGSGALGDIFSSILSKSNIHVSVVKGYLLPKTVTENSLVIVTSISGNTIETLTVLNEAKKRNCKIIAFSSGGKMEEYCNKKKIEYRKIPQIHSPRASFTKFLYSMLNVLKSVLPIGEKEIRESIKCISELNLKINSDNINEENPALSLANWIIGVPIIYYPYGLQAAAIRFKNSLQENAKTHAVTEDVIEACHNGIVSWERKSNFQPIFLQGNDDYIKTKERWKILKEFFITNNIEFWENTSVQGDILSKLIHLIYLYDYASIFLAVKNNIDPSPVKSIDFIKNHI